MRLKCGYSYVFMSVCLEVSEVEVIALCEAFHLVFVDAKHAVIYVCADVHHVVVDSCEFCLGHSASDVVDVGNCLLVLRHVCECLNFDLALCRCRLQR